MVGIENIVNHCFFNSLMHCVLNRQEVRHAVFNHFTFHTKGKDEQGKRQMQCDPSKLFYDMPSQILHFFLISNIPCVVMGRLYLSLVPNICSNSVC